MRPLRGSLAFSLGRDLLFSAVVGAAVLLVSLYVQLAMTEQELRQRSLDAAASNIAANLVVDAAGNAHLAAGAASASVGYPTLVFADDGRILYQRPAEIDPGVVAMLSRQRLAAPAQQHRLGQVGFFRVALRDRRIVGAALHAGTGADQHVIVVFKDENAPDVLINEVLREFPYRSAAVMLPVLLVLLLAGGLIVRRRMRPIAAASRLAETIGLDTLHIRLPQQEAPAELQPIIGAVNGAFDRLQQAVATQREFLRRAAHALRTPMAVLSARAGLVTDEETAGQLRTDVMELARIVSQFQQLNEIDALPVGSNAVADLCQVGETVRAETAAQAAARQIQLQLSHPEQPVRVRGEPHIIAVAARNLVENALQHAPCGGTVAIRIGEDGSIAVSDNGPGVPVELRGKIFEPFWSGDPDGRRIGLGLTVVRRIAERYGATVAVTGPASGGTTVALHFARPANAAGVAPV